MSAISRPLLKAPLAGTPADSVNAYNNQNAEAQANLANAVGGYKKLKNKSMTRRRQSQSKNKKKFSRKARHNKRSMRRVRGGAAQPAPYMAVPYPVTGAGGQDPNSIMYANAKNQNQAAANSIYDKEAANMKGGFLRRGLWRKSKPGFPKRPPLSKKKK